MRYSDLFPKALKDAPSDEVSASARYLIQAGFLYKESSGLLTILPLGQRVMHKINAVVRRKMNELGIQELTMPAISHIDRWRATGRDKMDVLYRVPSRSGSEYVLNPTAEELIAPLVKAYARSPRDFPLAFYQISNKYRDELRPKSGILRGREFLMKDAYSFHTSVEDRDQFYDRVAAKYHEVFGVLGIGEETLFTYASGGDFCQYSHEFQTIADIGEDTVFVCCRCRVAVNDEIISEHSACPKCGNAELERKRGIEVGNIFKLGTRFSEPLGLYVSMPDGRRVAVEMASYGIGCTRCLGAVVEVHHDERGIMWPDAVSPFQVHLLSVGKSARYADAIYEQLMPGGIEVLYDDRESVSAGEKFAVADLIGVPIRLVTSDRHRASDSVELKVRRTGETSAESRETLIGRLRRLEGGSGA